MPLKIGAQDLCIAVERCIVYQFKMLLVWFNKCLHSCTHITDFLRWNSCITSNERTPQTVMFSRHANTSGNHSVAGESRCSEGLDVNLELGNEVWDDFDDESLVEVMSVSAGAEKTAVSGKAAFFMKSFIRNSLAIFILVPETPFSCLFVCLFKVIIFIRTKKRSVSSTKSVFP